MGIIDGFEKFLERAVALGVITQEEADRYKIKVGMLRQSNESPHPWEQGTKPYYNYINEVIDEILKKEVAGRG